MYAELQCRSNYSFLQGASHPGELVERAAALGYAALALTDECSVAGVVQAHRAAKAAGLRLLVGARFRLAEGDDLTLLACNRAGYGQLCRLITRARRRAAKGDYRLSRGDCVELDDCLALLAADAPEDAFAWFADCFAGRGWLALALLNEGDDAQRLEQARDTASRYGLPLVAVGDVLMHVRGRRALADTLSAIRLGCTLEMLGEAALVNGERHLRPLEALRTCYPAALLAETLRVAGLCTFSLDELRYDYPDDVVPAGRDPHDFLREQVEQGMQVRWPDGCPDSVRAQIEHELALIAELRYEAYFLTVWDIVRFARGRSILCQGRGSAANSAVCYCLGITEVDPSRMNLLFERFVSRERDEPPDIDVDFEHERREEVVQYIYRRYGRERAALAATVITWRVRSAIRDVGRALGLEAGQVEALVTAAAAWRRRGELKPEYLAEAGFDPDNPRLHRLRVLVNELLGFPRHLSQHVGGFVIARGRLDELVPIENAAMPSRTVIQWEKDDLEALGLLKIDILSLGMLSAIRRCLQLIDAFGGPLLPPARGPSPALPASGEGTGSTPACGNHFDSIYPACGNPRDGSSPADGGGREGAAGKRHSTLADIPPEDPATYAMIRRADTIGVFQIESRAQMAMLPRLKPRTFYDLVIEVAIVRPGPIQGDMVHPYLRRRQGLEPVEYPSEAVREVLERTLGVPIFQEQVIRLAMVAAGFSAGEADGLRRAMAAWRRRGGLAPWRERLLRGMAERGYARDFAERIYRQILGFGEYGFPESHAASFALLAYASAWLKCHHPAAFCAALLNSQPMGFYAPAQLVRDAREHGVEVRPADVRSSDWDCTLEPADDEPARPVLRLGLRMIKGLSRAAGERLVTVRAQGDFRDVDDLARRAGLSRRELKALAAADALHGLAGHRHAAAWTVAGVEPQLPLFPHPGQDRVRPALDPPSRGRSVLADYHALGLSLRAHPLALLRHRLRARGLHSAAEVAALPAGARTRTAGLVLIRQRPGKGRAVYITLEDETGTQNLLIWADLAERERRIVLGAGLLGAEVEVQRAEGVQHLVGRVLEDHSDLLGELPVRSRDFH